MAMRSVRSFVLLTAIALVPSTAQAAPMTFSFSVRVTELVGSASTLLPTLAVGDTITGEFTFDSSTPDAVPANPLFGSYVSTPPTVLPFSTFVDVEGERFSWSGSRVAVTNTPAFDVYIIENAGVPSLPLGLTSASFIGQLNGGNPFTSDALPLTPPDPTLANTAPFSLWLGPNTGPDRIRGVVTEITAGVAQAPEPATLVLFGSGLFALARRRRRS